MFEKLRAKFQRPEPEPEPEPVATLTAEERKNVVEQKRLTTDALMSSSMMRHSYNALWANLKKQYELPDEFDFEDATGRIFAKKGS